MSLAVFSAMFLISRGATNESAWSLDLDAIRMGDLEAPLSRSMFLKLEIAPEIRDDVVVIAGKNLAKEWSLDKIAGVLGARWEKTPDRWRLVRTQADWDALVREERDAAAAPIRSVLESFSRTLDSGALKEKPLARFLGQVGHLLPVDEWAGTPPGGQITYALNPGSAEVPIPPGARAAFLDLSREAYALERAETGKAAPNDTALRLTLTNDFLGFKLLAWTLERPNYHTNWNLIEFPSAEPLRLPEGGRTWSPSAAYRLRDQAVRRIQSGQSVDLAFFKELARPRTQSSFASATEVVKALANAPSSPFLVAWLGDSELRASHGLDLDRAIQSLELRRLKGPHHFLRPRALAYGWRPNMASSALEEVLTRVRARQSLGLADQAALAAHPASLSGALSVAALLVAPAPELKSYRVLAAAGTVGMVVNAPGTTRCASLPRTTLAALDEWKTSEIFPNGPPRQVAPAEEYAYRLTTEDRPFVVSEAGLSADARTRTFFPSQFVGLMQSVRRSGKEMPLRYRAGVERKFRLVLAHPKGSVRSTEFLEYHVAPTWVPYERLPEAFRAEVDALLKR